MGSPKPDRVSLADFAAATGRLRQKCWLCTIPEREEVEAARRNGVFVSTIVEWLREACGYGDLATPNKVNNHLLSCAKIRYQPR